METISASDGAHAPGKLAPFIPNSAIFNVVSTIGFEGLFDNSSIRPTKVPSIKPSKHLPVAESKVLAKEIVSPALTTSSSSSIPNKSELFTLKPTVAPTPTMQTRVAVGNKIADQILVESQPPKHKMEVRMEMNVGTKPSPSIAQSRFVNNLAGTAAPVMGVITTTAGTMVRDGTTTVHETSVIGTLLDGSYVKVVESTSHIFKEPRHSTERVEPSLSPNRGLAEVIVEVEPKTSKAKLQSITVTSSTSASITASTVALQQHDSLGESSLPLESLFDTKLDFKISEPSELQALPVKQNRLNSLNGEVRALSDDFYEDDAEYQEEQTITAIKPSFQFSTSMNSVRHTRYAPSEIVSTVIASAADKHEYLPVPQGLIDKRAGLPSSQSYNSNSRSRHPTTEHTPANQGWNRQGSSHLAHSGSRRDSTRWRYTPSPKPRVPIVKQQPERRPTPVYEDDPYETSTVPAYSQTDQKDDEELQEIEPFEIKTLRVQTVTPEGYKGNLYFEIATIKSPYVMRVGTVKNTRYITMTKTFTRAVTPTPAPQFIPEVVVSSDVPIDPSLPLTENILATTQPYESILKDSSDIATLPAVSLAAGSLTIPLETVTETFSTTELMEKTSILPFVQNGQTSRLTLTQSYYITRLVTAVKTIPAADLYHFIPSNTLRDSSTVLQEAGSEHNERLLPGELEFSENDEYDDDVTHEHRVLPPANFQDPLLSSIGSDFDPSSMEKHRLTDLQPSLNSELLGGSAEPVLVTPPLQQPTRLAYEGDKNANSPQIAPSQEMHGLTPEQMQQLALYRYYNPYGAMPFGLPGLGGFGGLPGLGGGAASNAQIITTTRPVVKTSEIVQTNVIPLWDGAKTVFTTISRTIGTTTVTDMELGTTTLSGLANPFQQYTITSSPVTTEIMTTSTELKVYRIIFRAQTTVFRSSSKYLILILDCSKACITIGNIRTVPPMAFGASSSTVLVPVEAPAQEWALGLQPVEVQSTFTESQSSFPVSYDFNRAGSFRDDTPPPKPPLALP
nr:EOG090X017N [Lepidurus arcticus]